MFACDFCSKELKSRGGKGAHQRACQYRPVPTPTKGMERPENPIPAPEMPIEVPSEVQAPVGPIDYGRPPGGTLRASFAMREIKMLAPVCDTCQGSSVVAPNWWESCTHGPLGTPYFTLTREESKGFEAQPDGSYKQTSSETFLPMANVRQVSADDRHGTFHGRSAAEQKRAYGWILPEEHPSHPVKAYCEYRDCMSQKGLKQYSVGKFCRKREAQLVKMEQTGVAGEVFNDRIRAEQIDGIAV